MKEIQDLLDWFPYCLLMALPVFIALSPVPVSAVYLTSPDFQVHRLAQYEFGGILRGSKAAAVSMDARPVQADPSNLLRKVVVARCRDVTPGVFDLLVSSGAGCILMVIPDRTNISAALSGGDKEAFLVLEKYLLDSVVEIPVYFAEENEHLLQVLEGLEMDGSGDVGRKPTAAENLLRAVASTGYQLIAQSSGVPKPSSDAIVRSIEGKLFASGEDDSHPTIAVVAHYDSLGAAPSLSYGSDSNGSGVIVLLEVARLMRKLYQSGKSRPNVNMVFLLSGGGKLNYFGTRKWLDEHLESTELLANLKYAVCLDTLGNGGQTGLEGLRLHVSKKPKEDSPPAKFFDILKSLVGKAHLPSIDVELVHKKINLKENYLQWEHEPFSIGRLSAFTLSNVDTHDSWMRAPSILDRTVDVRVLSDRVRLISESLACSVYNLAEEECEGNMFGDKEVDKANIEAWTSYLSETPRFAGMLSTGRLTDYDTVVTSLHDALKFHVHSVRYVNHKRDKKEPEFNFYDLHTTTMSAHRVKPAVFDLFLSVGIGSYLFIVYIVIVNYSVFCDRAMMILSRIVSQKPSSNVKLPSGQRADSKTNGFHEPLSSTVGDSTVGRRYGEKKIA